MNDTTNAAKRPSGLRACADGLDANPDKDFAQKCMRHAADRMEDLETELTAVTEQRDKALQKIKNQAERIAYLEGATNHATGTPLSKAIEQRDRLAAGLEVAQQVGIQLGEQRDRLAEALTEIARGEPNWADCVVLAREALQSLNQPERTI